MREIVFDTETTGLDPLSGHRVIEIGCLELENYLPTGRHFHAYLNPERDVPEASFKVHGLSEEFLSDKPLFEAVAEDFLSFVGQDRLIIHNASFDMGFINAELARVKRPALSMDQAFDTVKLARERFPGSPANLDALCRRFDIDLSERSLHGALLDCRLLAEVYLELLGGRQPGLVLGGLEKAGSGVAGGQAIEERQHRPARAHAPTAEEEAAHAAFMGDLKEPIWQR